jgi:hypothetical protein
MHFSGLKAVSSAAPDFESSLEDPAAMLAREPNHMSMQEREEVIYEVHGMAPAFSFAKHVKCVKHVNFVKCVKNTTPSNSALNNKFLLEKPM